MGQDQWSSALKGLWQLLASAVPSGKNPNSFPPPKVLSSEGAALAEGLNECCLLCHFTERGEMKKDLCVSGPQGPSVTCSLSPAQSKSACPHLDPTRISILTLAS